MIQAETPDMDMPPDYIRLPPQAIDAEQSVLGGLMLDNRAWDRIADVVTEKDFYRRDHRTIFQHIAGLIERNYPADALTVAESIGDGLKNVGGAVYLGELAANTPSAANIRRYAEIVRDRAQKRELIALANELTGAAYSGASVPASELLAKAQDSLFALAQRNTKKGARPFISVLSEVVEGIDKRYTEGGAGITGLETGFVDLDEKTAGLQPSDLIVIAGRPSMGKTAIAMNMVEHVTLALKKTAAVFSLEMSDRQLVQRMLGSVGLLNQHQLRTGKFQEDDWPRIVDATGKLREAKVIIEEPYGLSTSELRAKARQIQRENPDLALIVVDYLQLMEAEGGNRTEQIANISRALKRTAKELNIPVIALSQLNRSLDQRADKRPMMSDLRESGAIEQDADVILFMYRDEVYNEDSPRKGVAEVIIGKQRNGPIGRVFLSFRAQYARFENYAGEPIAYAPKPKSRAFDEPRRERADIDK